MKTGKIILRIAAIILCFLLVCFSAGFIDYLRVFELEKEPFFCIPRRIRDDAKIYYGPGYTYTFITEDGKLKYIDFENIIGANVYWVDCS